MPAAASVLKLRLFAAESEKPLILVAAGFSLRFPPATIAGRDESSKHDGSYAGNERILLVTSRLEDSPRLVFEGICPRAG